MNNETAAKQELLYRNFLDDVSPLIPYFDDQFLTDIYINPCENGCEVVTESIQDGVVFTGLTLDEYQAEAIIISAASLFKWNINPYADVPKVEGVLPAPYKLRFTGLLPPCVDRPAIALRRPPSRVFSLEEYLKEGRLSREYYDIICRTIEDRGNILVCGSTGSGKTTFTNAVLKKMVEYCPLDRFYLVEDVKELICTARNKVSCFASHPDSSASELVQESLRFTPKRIIFGELRYPQVAFDYVTALQTGHCGNVTTIHANDCCSALYRLNSLCNMATKNPAGQLEYPEILSLVVHLNSVRGFRVVDEIRQIAA
jgi:type IV secretion system protein TrbB